MAILTFAPAAHLQGFLAWAQFNGQPPAVPCPQGDIFTLLAPLFTRGTYAESGDVVRYSAFLASGDAVIDFGGQWADNRGVYKRYNHVLSLSSASSPARATAPASAGWYRDAAASLRTVGITGQTLYVTQELGRTDGGNFAPFAMLAQGWLTSAAPVSGTTPDTGGGGGGGGCCIGALHSDIASGTTSVNYTIPVAAGQRARLTLLLSVYATSGVAGNRLATITVRTASHQGYEVEAIAVQTASTSRGYAWQIGGGRSTNPVTGYEYLPLPSEAWFDEDIDVEVTCLNIGAGDDWSTADISWETQGP